MFLCWLAFVSIVLGVRDDAAATIAGVVVDASGDPVAAARVVAMPELIPREASLLERLQGLTRIEELRSVARFTASTDAQGRFRIVVAPRAQYRLRVGHDAFAPSELRYVAAGALQTRCTLRAGSELVGVVTDRAGMPVPRARIAVHPEVSSVDVVAVVANRILPPLTTVTCDELGKFRFRSMGGKLRVKVRAPAYQRQERILGVPSEPVVFSLEPGLVLSGSVQDAAGQPVPGAWIEVNDRDPKKGADDPFTTRTDAAGKYSFNELGRGRYRLLACSEISAVRQMNVSLDGDQELAVVLQPGTAVSGVVVDSRSGTPVPGARISHRVGAAPPRSATTDGRGQFQLAGVAAAQPSGAVLSVEAPGFAPRHDVRVLIRQRTEVTDLEVHLDAHASVSGVVLADGKPVPGCRLVVQRQHSPQVPVVVAISSTVESDAQGRFRVPDVLPGEGAFVAAEHAEHMAARSREFFLAPGAEQRDLTIQLGRPGMIEGAISNTRGEPIAEARIGVRGDALLETDPGKMQHQAVTDRGGQFRIFGLAGGAVALRIVAPGYRPLDVPAHITAGEITELKITLQRSATLIGLVVDVTGQPVSGAKITVTDTSDGLARLSAETDAAGRFRVAGLGVDPVQVKIEAAGLETRSLRDVTVGPEETVFRMMRK